MQRRFQPSYSSFRPYGAEDDAAEEAETVEAEPAAKKKKRKKKKGFEWTPEATEGAIALIGTGAKLATKAIEAKSKKGKGKKKKAAEPSYTPPPTSAPAPAPSGPSPVVLAVGGLVVVGGLLLFLSSQKKSQPGAGTGAV